MPLQKRDRNIPHLILSCQTYGEENNFRTHWKQMTMLIDKFKKIVEGIQWTHFDNAIRLLKVWTNKERLLQKNGTWAK